MTSRIWAGGIALALVLGACGSDDDDDASSDTGEAPVESDESVESDETSSDERESPYEVDAVDPVDQGVATLTIDGTTYEFVDLGDPEDERDGTCGKGEVADQLEVTVKHVDEAGEPVPRSGAEGFFNTLFVDLPYNQTFSPDLEFQVDDTVLMTSAPDRPTVMEWGFSPDGLHAEGTVTLYDRDDDTAEVEGTFSITCPAA